MGFNTLKELGGAHLGVGEFRAARMRLPESTDAIFQFFVRFALISVLKGHDRRASFRRNSIN